MNQTPEERLSEETGYTSLKDALEAAVRSMRADEDDLEVFENGRDSWLTVHTRNQELAVQLGYQLIAGFEEILEISESEKDVLSAWKELQEEEEDYEDWEGGQSLIVLE